ncbi:MULTISPECIES: crotonase/enoyl-CoA hydratase family protein [Rhodobacterales]|jgi:enoyl-CoA hydratase/carnithine racemase|uniref:crotonase/enoyl-CoA hydratase family protein n=1 Tax=Rhodobacterales TaxID=204455 RepID=UPI00237FA0D2|nr:crotonase/enoyl-CoA hydratase family protein [Phaeobacter gallaeciensis]MDE4141995.1 crotonase/enoyl-CoA hydratase family protein [Phaeobacter gallaeciensis]MDE4150441.1 crotonase/enoyl-CoA hydratase family protein [Phaeobacter gallaeciensis]MDE4154717.1 crotonase/enoyl-CoA hydratase family protein [Phaeobacter gallaeciensis]MDE4190963.1 crotonase/enoyl-CoA hydratase family protein [Phaeobacter gallaeciensis]MDE4199429.1 crotonase/enoyl-CoA hydratase family protein [Phaeobacter gallaeciensi
MSDQILKIDINDSIATLTMNRPDKRNAMCEELLEALDAFFSAPPKEVRVVILTGTAGHFCSGLDLSEHVHRSAEENLYHSRQWHQVMEKIQFGGLAVVSAMFGAVIGGGLELASSTHVRIAEPSTIFQLPEGRRGIFVGGGATARVGRLLGADRMTEMMLTGRKYDAETGVALGLAHYAVGEGEALELAQTLAGKIARNAPLSNYLMIQSIARINDMSQADGLFTESLAAALSQTTPDAEEGLRAFLEKRAPKFR